MTSTKRIGILTLALGGVFAMASANAQTQTPEQRYQQELRQCEQLSPTVDMQACKREAGAALQASRRGNLQNHNGMNYDQNRTERCAALPAGQRDECMMQMSGQNTRTMGSVEEGGILRETTITVPATQ
ncbi:hypothetical protein [Neopusillimonas maritima]|jgi:hypothetical protein|uniref:Uncharacterized protein n=1 Tax=Neopusillimonas maritima TaxID=2026239 RepID=A0ABX9MXV1_9BURK|nr:hypothetical protein [Neopusillimonas maritima]MBF23631.1 hypothetical protein [Pusillimonas sp.]MBF24480.1 hypothetical protein [Pusillimonas sp.]RII83804.1 hypothetical protein CJO09_00730 [Neopusillimonas maritima]|tara:strand:- start:4382 stop:4768 length:387 start_codon:yes stop_codon:yes gene_type:complete